MYDKLVAKVNNIDTSRFVLKTKYAADKSNLGQKISDAGKKISDTCARVKKKTDYSAKISEIESKKPSISGLVTNSSLTAVENKITNVSNLVKITDYDIKITDIENKYIATADYDKFTKDIVANNIKSKNLVDKSDHIGFRNNVELDNKVAALATKAELKAKQNKIIKLQVFDSIYF